MAFPLAPAALLVCLYVNALGCELGNLARHIHHRDDWSPGELSTVLPKDPIPVVMGYNTFSFQMLHNAPADLRRRIVYLCDIEMARRWIGIDTAERGLAGLGDLAPAPVQPYREFLRTNRRFWLVLATDSQSWLVDQLLKDGAMLTVRASYQGEPVFEVISP